MLKPFPVPVYTIHHKLCIVYLSFGVSFFHLLLDLYRFLNRCTQGISNRFFYKFNNIGIYGNLLHGTNDFKLSVQLVGNVPYS